MGVFLRILISVAVGCQVTAAICQVAAAYQRMGNQHTADMWGYSGIGVGVVLAVAIFCMTRRLSELDL